MAIEWSRYNIRVNALAPGYFITEINQEQFADSSAEDFLMRRVPMSRVGDLREIAGPLLLLASDAGSYMTGSIIAVDGGHVCSSL
jgi:NAD(P)-dependent dehydrogenase (short-subunit alcohol dehydrogenase family)